MLKNTFDYHTSKLKKHGNNKFQLLLALAQIQQKLRRQCTSKLMNSLNSFYPLVPLLRSTYHRTADFTIRLQQPYSMQQLPRSHNCFPTTTTNHISADRTHRSSHSCTEKRYVLKLLTPYMVFNKEKFSANDKTTLAEQCTHYTILL